MRTGILTKGITEKACGDHPAFLYGREGEQVHVLRPVGETEKMFLVQDMEHRRPPYRVYNHEITLEPAKEEE